MRGLEGAYLTTGLVINKGLEEKAAEEMMSLGENLGFCLKSKVDEDVGGSDAVQQRVPKGTCGSDFHHQQSESCVQRNKHTDLHEDLNMGIGFPGKRKGS